MDTPTKQVSKQAIPKTKAERKRFLAEHPGILTHVARRHGLNSGHVSLVFNGHTKSARVLGLIEKEAARQNELAERESQSTRRAA